MKKAGLLICIIPNLLFAQLPDSSIAPNWMVNDINGNPHELYSYLDSGYTVFLDICAAWCPPCYWYHETGKMDTLWANHGPGGTNEIRVFYIEGDSATTLNELYGIGVGSFGDYVTGTQYPILLDGYQIYEDYQNTYYPTIYMICPERITTEVGQGPSWQELYKWSQLSCDVSQTYIESPGNKSEITLFPNPFTDQLFIQLDNTSDVEINVFNNLGQKVGYRKYGETNLVQYHAPNLEPGVYYFDITVNDKRSTHRIHVVSK